MSLYKLEQDLIVSNSHITCTYIPKEHHNSQKEQELVLIRNTAKTHVVVFTADINDGNLQGAAIKNTPLQKSYYFQNKLIFFW